MVVERARHIQGEVAAIAADVAALRDVVTGDVRLGCIGTVGRWLAPLVLQRATAEPPRSTWSWWTPPRPRSCPSS